MRVEYDLLNNTEPLLLYFSIVNFSNCHLNQLLGCQAKFLNFSALSIICGINSEMMTLVTDKIKAIFNSCKNSKDKYRYLKETEISIFLED